MLINLISLVSFLVIGMFVLWLGRRFREDETSSEPRVSSIDAMYGPASPLVTAFAGALPLGKRFRDSLQNELVRAGYYRPAAIDRFLGTRNAVIMIWVLFAAFVLVMLPAHHRIYQTKFLWSAAVGALLLFGLPRVVLSAQANARSRRIEKALPDALDMITMTMSGGVSMRDAMRHVRGEIHDSHSDLASELNIIEKQADTGTLANALDRFAQRVDLPDVTGLAALMKQNDRLGGQVVETLRTYADDVRQKRRQMAEEHGNKASIKLLLPVVFCLAPPIYILLLGPAVMELRDFITRENEAGGVLSQNVVASASLRPGRGRAPGTPGNRPASP